MIEDEKSIEYMRRFGHLLPYLAFFVMLYVYLDVESNLLPLITNGTANLKDVPMGTIGLVVATHLFYKQKESIDKTF